MREAGHRVSRLANGATGLLTAAPIAGHSGACVLGAEGGAFCGKAGMERLFGGIPSPRFSRRRTAWRLRCRGFSENPGSPRRSPGCSGGCKGCHDPCGPGLKKPVPTRVVLD